MEEGEWVRGRRRETRKELSEGRSCPALRPVARSESHEAVNGAPDVYAAGHNQEHKVPFQMLHVPM